MRSVSLSRLFFLVPLLLLCSTAAALGRHEASVPVLQSESEDTAIQSLPLDSVTIYTNGVAFFRREGTVTDTVNLEFQFRESEINDLLKSLSIRDLDGGRIGSVNYGSQDPQDRRLKSFAVDLSGDLSLAAILKQLKGEEIRISAGETAEGILSGVETRSTNDGTDENYLILFSSRGLSSIPLDSINTIAFLDPFINNEFLKALDVLSDSRNTDKKALRILLEGKGQRRISMGYVSEAPVWKTSYRLFTGEGNEQYLQAWAIIENTTDEDWQNIELSLVSGRPSSFIMDLASPRYIERPRIQVPGISAPIPESYENRLSMAMAPKSRSQADTFLQEAESSIYADSAAPADYGSGVQAYGIQEGSGNFVRYTIDHRVSLPRRESAMFPLADTVLEGQLISIYDRTRDSVHPMQGIELYNSSSLHFSAGPLSVYHDGNYAGDALIDDFLPGIERLISFALDMETEVTSLSGGQEETINTMSLSNGLLILNKIQRRTSTYSIKNNALIDKEILIIRPLDSGWTIIKPEELPEINRNTQRFRIKAAARKTEELTIVEERQLRQNLQLVSLNDTQLVRYSSESAASGAVRAAFARIMDKRNTIQQITAERQETERRLRQFREEQDRIRGNMGALSENSTLYQRYMELLGEQEQEIAALLLKNDSLHEQEKRLSLELSELIQGFSI